MKLDEENRITETYQKIGNAEVLKIEDNPLAEEITTMAPLAEAESTTAQNIVFQDVATSPRYSQI